MKLNENPLRGGVNNPYDVPPKQESVTREKSEREREEKLYSNDREIKAKIKNREKTRNKNRKERKNQNTFKPKSNGLICEGFNKNSSMIINILNDQFIHTHLDLVCFVLFCLFILFFSDFLLLLPQ